MNSQVNYLLVEVIVLLSVGWAATLYNWRRKWGRQQRAWQWWHRHQALKSHHTAESIRDGLLQQTFAFRRYLETMEAGNGKALSPEEHPPSAKQTTRWLERFQTFYQSLETLSDELSPPFIADSLPLALKFTLNSWSGPLIKDRPGSKPPIRFQLPADWPADSAQQNQVILSILTALLTLLLPEGHSTEQIEVTLNQEDAANILTLKIASESDLATSKILEMAELQHLKEIFHSLAAGELEISQEGRLLIACLCWKASGD